MFQARIHSADIEVLEDRLRFWMLNHRPAVDVAGDILQDATKFGANSTIEVFDHTRGPSKLEHVRTISSESIISPNSLVRVRNFGSSLLETNVVRAMGHLRSIVPPTMGQLNPDVTLAVGYVMSCAWSRSNTNSRRCRPAAVVSILRTTMTGRLEWYAINVPNQSKQSLRRYFSSAISKCFVGGGSVTYCDFDECHIAAPKIFSYANGIVKGQSVITTYDISNPLYYSRSCSPMSGYS